MLPSHHRKTLFFSMVVLSVAAYYWRCQFGVDLTDEAFYLNPPWKFFGLGDRPFHDEIFNGLRHSDLLNYLFVRPFLSYSVLTLRHAAVLTYAFVLLLLTLKVFRNRLGISAGFTYVALLWFDYFLMPTWSYNWWARNLLILHTLFILNAAGTGGKNRRAQLGLAGFCLGIAIVAYNSLAPLALVALGILAFQKCRRSLLMYVGALALPIICLAAYLAMPGVFPDWVISVRSMTTMVEYSGNGVGGKAALILNFLVQSVGLLLQHPSPRDVNQTLVGFLVLGLVGGSWSWYRALRSSDGLLTLALSVPLLASILIGLSSASSYYAMIWAMPALILPLVGLHWREPKREFLASCFMGYLAYSSVTYQRHHTYYDVPPGNCEAELSVPPLQGLKTSRRRAELVMFLADLVKDKKFVLSFADNPGTYYFGDVRPAVDASIVETYAARETNERSLRRMVERGRFPEVVIQTKVHPWYWGIHHPLSEEPYPYTSDDPYLAFTQCARADTLHSFPELEVYTLHPAKLNDCLEQTNRVARGRR